jgi:hypothetical protein
MARRRSSSRSSSSSSSGGRRGYGGKSGDEARVERLTWGLLVLAFAIIQLTPQSAATLPNWFIPMAGAVILLGSGIYQYTRRWRVSPITWLAGGIMLFFALYNIYINPAAQFLGLSLVIFALVILFGLVTNET